MGGEPAEIAAHAEAGAPGKTAAEASLRLVEVVEVAVDLPGSHPVLDLREIEGPGRELRMPIGMAEGVALAHAWRATTTRRPLTHELCASILERLDVSVEAVRIVAVEDGIYVGELVLAGRQGTEVFPCRPTDGITLALRQRLPVPILVAEELLAPCRSDRSRTSTEPG